MFQNNKLLIYISILFLAVAANMKFYPALFGLILVNKDNISKVPVALIFGIVLFIVPLFAFNGFETVNYILKGLKHFRAETYYNNFGIKTYSHILFDFINNNFKTNIDVELVAKILIILVLVICVIYCAKEEHLWKKCLMISITIILCLDSGGYDLIYFVLAFILFVKENKTINWSNAFYFISFCLIIIVKPPIYINNILGITIDNIINKIIIIVVLIKMLYDLVKEKYIIK